MDINNLPDGAKVKINKNSITVLSDAGKTAGIITGLQPFLTLQANKQIIYAKTLRTLRIWGASDRKIDKTYIHNNKIVQLRSLNSYDYKTPEEKAAEDSYYSELTAAGVIVKAVYIYA